MMELLFAFKQFESKLSSWEIIIKSKKRREQSRLTICIKELTYTFFILFPQNSSVSNILYHIFLIKINFCKSNSLIQLTWVLILGRQRSNPLRTGQGSFLIRGIVTEGAWNKRCLCKNNTNQFHYLVSRHKHILFHTTDSTQT